MRESGTKVPLVRETQVPLPASLASILNATTPLFTAVVAALWLGDALTVRKGAGLILGISGVGAVVGWSPVHPNLLIVASAGCSLLAALCYGIGGVYARARLTNTPPLTLATGQQLGAGLVLLPVAIFQLPAQLPRRRRSSRFWL